MADSDERRKRIRVPVTQMVRHSLYQVLGTPVFQENSSIDISSGGIAFETVQEYPLGTLVLLEVTIEQQLLKLLICVAWVKKNPENIGKFQIGGELIAIDPEHKKTMQAHLMKMIKKIQVRKKPKKKAAKKVVKKSKFAKNKSAQKKPAKKTAKKKSKKK